MITAENDSVLPPAAADGMEKIVRALFAVGATKQEVQKTFASKMLAAA